MVSLAVIGVYILTHTFTLSTLTFTRTQTICVPSTTLAITGMMIKTVGALDQVRQYRLVEPITLGRSVTVTVSRNENEIPEDPDNPIPISICLSEEQE